MKGSHTILLFSQEDIGLTVSGLMVCQMASVITGVTLIPLSQETRKSQGVTIGITGYRWSGLSGQSTATYNLTLTVEEEILDTDGDGIGDTEDLDDDGDGVYDADDAFPLDASESSDTDGDGIGNNADTDDDGDGTLDENDTFPLDPAETTDTNGDGIGNNADHDDDGDGVLDENDAFPLDPAETTDTDGDGIGDNSDTDYNGNGIEDSIEFSGSIFRMRPWIGMPQPEV